MLERLTLATFADKIGHTFRIHATASHVIDTRLVEARSLDARSADGKPWVAANQREPFSIVFHGPGSPHLPQQIYRVSHDSLGDHEIFLVPIGTRDGGLLYEAIFA